VNTLAPASIESLQRGEGHQEAGTVERGVDEAHQVMADLAAAGVDIDDVTATLEREGVESFANSFRDAFTTIEKRRAEVGS
jgi:transaldolase